METICVFGVFGMLFRSFSLFLENPEIFPDNIMGEGVVFGVGFGQGQGGAWKGVGWGSWNWLVLCFWRENLDLAKIKPLLLIGKKFEMLINWANLKRNTIPCTKHQSCSIELCYCQTPNFNLRLNSSLQMHKIITIGTQP